MVTCSPSCFKHNVSFTLLMSLYSSDEWVLIVLCKCMSSVHCNLGIRFWCILCCNLWYLIRCISGFRPKINVKVARELLVETYWSNLDIGNSFSLHLAFHTWLCNVNHYVSLAFVCCLLCVYSLLTFLRGLCTYQGEQTTRSRIFGREGCEGVEENSYLSTQRTLRMVDHVEMA